VKLATTASPAAIGGDEQRLDTRAPNHDEEYSDDARSAWHTPPGRSGRSPAPIRTILVRSQGSGSITVIPCELAVAPCPRLPMLVSPALPLDVNLSSAIYCGSLLDSLL